MAAALNLLSTPDIFRDMSGRAEVADLLKHLSDKTIDIAEAANRAREIQAKYGEDLSKKTGSTAATSGGTTTGGASTGGTNTGGTNTTSPQDLSPQEDQAHQEKILETSEKYLAPPQKRKVRENYTQHVTKSKKVWTVSFASKWSGETLEQPMKATYIGELFFGAKGDSKVLSPQTGSQNILWDVESDKNPLGLSMIAMDIEPYTGGFSISVPGITVDGLALKEANYQVPLRAAASNLAGELRSSVPAIKVNQKSTVLYFQGIGKIGKRDIKVTAEVGAGGELVGEFGRSFEKEATIEIVKLAVSSTLKAAAKTTLNGKMAIEGTFEILYLIGYEIKQIEIS